LCSFPLHKPGGLPMKRIFLVLASLSTLVLAGGAVFKLH